MFVFCTVLFAAGFQVISAQGPPPNLPQQCRGPPPGVEKPHECCKIPPFFTEEDFAECGFQKLDGPGHGKHRGPPDCSKQLCMLKKYNLLKDETSIDTEGVATFLDKWAEVNEVFKPTIEVAKDRCLGKELPGPPQICEANKLVFCISSTLFSDNAKKFRIYNGAQTAEQDVKHDNTPWWSECPAWEQTDGCQILKEHLELCKPFFNP